MTADKARKRAVRARMRQTGEPYAEAARRLAEQRAALAADPSPSVEAYMTPPIGALSLDGEPAEYTMPPAALVAEPCPNCGCCTARLCERGRLHPFGCIVEVSDPDAREQVADCPCAHGPGSARGELRARSAGVTDPAERREIAAQVAAEFEHRRRELRWQ